MSGIQSIGLSQPGEEGLPFSAAVVAGQWVFVSGQLAGDGSAGHAEAARARQETPFYVDAHVDQSAQVYQQLECLMQAAGGSIDDLVRITQWFPVPDAWRHRQAWADLSITRYLEERDRHIKRDRPASVGLGVQRLSVPDAVLAVDVVGRLPSGGERKESVYPKTKKHQVLAGYSPAMRMGDWVFCSGEVPTDWRGDWGSNVHLGTPSSVAPEARVNSYHWLDYPIRRQTDYVLHKLAETAEAAGTSLEHAVKATVYLVDPQDFFGFEEVWRRWFPSSPPARTVIPNVGLGPVGSLVEIALDILMPEVASRRQVIETSAAQQPLTHEPQAIRVDDLVFLSGLMASDRQGLAREAQVNPLLPYYTSAPKRELRYALRQAEAICQAAGTSLANLVRVQQLVTDLHQLPAHLEVWREQFPSRPPAGLVGEVAAPLLVPGCTTLLDLIAYVA